MEIFNGNGLDIPPANTTALVLPIMYAISSALLLGASILQAVLGYPEASRARWHGDVLKRDVDSFVTTEEPIALQKLLCNIGANGCAVAGASSGLVIASPSKSNPDCEQDPSDDPMGSLLTGGFRKISSPGLETALWSSKRLSIDSPRVTMRTSRPK